MNTTVISSAAVEAGLVFPIIIDGNITQYTIDGINDMLRIFNIESWIIIPGTSTSGAYNIFLIFFIILSNFSLGEIETFSTVFRMRVNIFLVNFLHLIEIEFIGSNIIIMDFAIDSLLLEEILGLTLGEIF